MTITRGVLGCSKLTTGSADLYSPSSKTGLVHNISLFNNNATAETVRLVYNSGSADFPILEASVASKETLILQFGNEGFVVPDAGKITGYSTTTSYVTCKIDGSEETS